MKESLMDIICCPICKKELELKVDEKDKEKEEILKGKLICKSCDENYPIENGIPDLLPPEMR